MRGLRSASAAARALTYACVRAYAASACVGALALAPDLAACSPPGRDTVPESRDVRGAEQDAQAPPSKDGYAYVTRRPHGAVGLVGAHFMSDDDARRVVDRIADELESCAVRLDERGELVEGAVQLVAVAGQHGNGEITDIRFAPGGPVAANALACIVAPLRVSPFPAATAIAGGPAPGLPAVAIEATWAPNRGLKPRITTDAG